MVKEKTIMFLVTEDWYFISHRLNYAKFLKKKGYQIHLCCKNTGKFKQISEQGIYCHDIRTSRKSLSVYRFISEVLSFVKYVQKIHPQIIHLISLRPAVVGLLASIRFRKIKVFITFTGLGFIFIREDLLGKILKFVIRFFFIIISLLKSFKVIVQNKDDYNFLRRSFLLKKKNIYLIRGSGIDLNHFKFSKEPNTTKLKICYIGRMLEDKGVHWLIEGFILARRENKNIFLILAGPVDKQNPTAIKITRLRKVLSEKSIQYLGSIDNVKKLWRNSHVGVLLSKREGLPMSLMEAAATGRPLIATDVPGCREIALPSTNAITVKPGDIEAIKNAILTLANDKTLRLQYGKNSRKIVESDLETKKVFKKYLTIYKI